MDKNYNELWDLVTKKELSVEEVDAFSIQEIETLDDLFVCYFSQMGEMVDMKYPFSINYIRVNKKVKKLKL